MDLNFGYELDFYSFDHIIQNELHSRQKSLKLREIDLFKRFQSQSENPTYPKYLPKFIHFDGSDPKISFDSLDDYEQAKLPSGLSVKQTGSAIIALAKFHAFSMENLNLTNAPLMPFTRVDPLIEQSVKEWLIEDLLHLPSSDEEGADYFAKNERAFRDFCLETSFSDGGEGDGKHHNYPVVLCHGNFSLENIFFKSNKENDDGKIDVRIVNWHLAQIGNGLTDLAHLLLSSVNSADRAEHFDHWIDLYISTFEQECQKLSSKGKANKKGKWAKFGPDKPARQFHSLVRTQLIRVLPKLALEYRKFVEAGPKGEGEQQEQFEKEKHKIFEMMTGGFEMIRKEFEH